MTVMEHFLTISEKLQDAHFDALLITSASNRLYASGFSSTAGMAFITGARAFFMTDSRYAEAAAQRISGAEVIPVSGSRDYYSVVNELIVKYSVKSIGIEENDLSLARFGQFQKKIQGELCYGGELLAKLRAVKSREELEIMMEAQRIAECALSDVLPMIHPDMTERELAAELVYRMMKHGAEDKSFDPIVVSGAKSSMPHGEPENIKLQNGFLTMDFGAKYKGYCSDMTRTVCIGTPTDEMRRVYETVLEAQKKGIAAARAGVTGDAVDAAARQVIADAGYGDYFGHAFGHSLGIDIHESPNAAPSANDPLPAGAVISAEPGIYIPGKFGVRIEDVLYITEDGSVNLATAEKDLIIL